MQVISYTAARSTLAKTMTDVCNNHEPIVITRSNSESAVLISLEDFEAMEETNYLLKSSKNAARLAESIAEVEVMITKQQQIKKK
ncbi:MAG: type II toxin-antitoxin system prevent-host-death family antitoxin [Gammaproteobacteria bacterium]|nr:type II toxin-antitoxin system prevent-host-death family antitoxin [Gammaproteobacteria bacterium]